MYLEIDTIKGGGACLGGEFIQSFMVDWHQNFYNGQPGDTLSGGCGKMTF